jgi:hypothetical protein
VRELENVIERSFILCNQDFIGIDHLPDEFTARGAAAAPASDMRTTRDLLEAEAIRTALERHSYNRLATAKELGMHKSTLFRKNEEIRDPPSQAGRPLPADPNTVAIPHLCAYLRVAIMRLNSLSFGTSIPKENPSYQIVTMTSACADPLA